MIVKVLVQQKSYALNLHAANPTFDLAGSQLKFRGGGGVIPHEDKWKLINKSTLLFRGGGEFDPL